MNLSETAFLHRMDDGYRLRWFTPAIEVDLCGHATLASAHVLWEEGHLPADAPARFHTRSGLLTATRGDGWIEMDFPAKPASAAAPPAGLEQALGVAARYVGRTFHQKIEMCDYLVEVDGEDIVRKLRPNFALLESVWCRGVIVTSAAAGPPYDFVSRFFAPRAGVNEDPVTGSAHCCLGPYWQRRLGKDALLARQVSARGGDVRVRIRGDRVVLGGQAVTVLRGELC
jgi:PhzF family phenazine biosynthesis protein